MSRRVLYILIVVFVLVVGIFVVRPMLTKKPAKSSKARTRRTTETDTGAAAGRTTPARGRARVTARGRAAREAAAAVGPAETKPAAVEAPAPVDSTPLTWHEDPFVRDWIMAGELRDLKLRAVTIGERSLALINDRIVAQGDTVNGKRVAAIARDSVVFEFGGQRRSLKIGE